MHIGPWKREINIEPVTEDPDSPRETSPDITEQPAEEPALVPAGAPVIDPEREGELVPAKTG